MEPIEKALITDFTNSETEFEDKIDEVNRFYEDDTNAKQFEPDCEYLCIGFAGMQDEIVLVSKHGRIFSLPFDESFIHVDY